jgi:hypothetical protein
VTAASLDDTVAHVRTRAPVDRPSFEGTRWKAPKVALARVLRLVTAPQAAFNHASADAVEHLAAELAACRRELAATRAKLHRLEHAVREVHGPLLADLIERT